MLTAGVLASAASVAVAGFPFVESAEPLVIRAASLEVELASAEVAQQHLVTIVDDEIASTRRGLALATRLEVTVDRVDDYMAEVSEDVRRERMAATWDRLADCESGDWHNGQPLPGTRRWDYGLTFSHGDIFEGGVNFHPRTWDQYRDDDMPGHAGQATRAQQIAVSELVLRDQGWGAWPVCSRKLGLR